ncbi:MAG: hypothetical protein E6J34_24170, partial [Chloroflexi bacterium]
PHIDWSYTPFVVQRTLSEWKRPLLAGKEVPRRAGISSFGAGGSNAHVVLEEYVEKYQSEAINRSPSYAVLIVLSARTREQLHQRVQQLLVWIQEEGGAEASVGLHNLAYTLQMGREAMEERLALQISSLAELEEELRRYIEGRHEGGNCYRGQAKQHDPLRTFAADEDGQKAIAAWM